MLLQESDDCTNPNSKVQDFARVGHSLLASVATAWTKKMEDRFNKPRYTSAQCAACMMCKKNPGG
eukprot:NODE_28157_length_207_cov_0.974684_g26987_i0.p1 GENE.NODE_28157_length_207_cov_0.974684_g26987_i0~~NODE_28157_length_207_cov_0.974684_g26987_i0.p1  ORF type:complete len:65 (-),score=8.58 NODE_28157_length_207_cov_0.974684_g26987_i0:13-207(-)